MPSRAWQTNNTSRTHLQPLQSETFISLSLGLAAAEHQNPHRRMNGSFLCKLRDDLLRLCFYSPPVTAEAERLQARRGAGECWAKAKSGSVERWRERREQWTSGGGRKKGKKATNLSAKQVNMMVTSVSPCMIRKTYQDLLRVHSATCDCLRVPAAFWKTLNYLCCCPPPSTMAPNQVAVMYYPHGTRLIACPPFFCRNHPSLWISLLINFLDPPLRLLRFLVSPL